MLKPVQILFQLIVRSQTFGLCLPTSSPAASLGQARASSAPPPKCKKTSVPFVVKETWTHEFFCLADHLQNKQRSRTNQEKFQLPEAGLGRKSVVFHRKDQALAFVEKLESVYPKLNEAGGFEILRSGPSNKDLVVINPPASGHSVLFLRESSGIEQALAYIRPLQRSLSFNWSLNRHILIFFLDKVSGFEYKVVKDVSVPTYAHFCGKW